MVFDKQIHAHELKLRVLVTNSCNRSCPFCLNDFQEKGLDFIDFDVFRRALKSYTIVVTAPLQVYFSGGEPTLHSQFIDMLKLAKEAGCRVTVNTNGTYSQSVDIALALYADQVHFGVYGKDEEVLRKILRVKGSLQCVYSKKYPYVDFDFIEYYAKYGIPIKVFRDFSEPFNDYEEFAYNLIEKFPGVSFRFTGTQENRGLGCRSCNKSCVTLKAAWLFPDNGTSPCPQLYKHAKVYPQGSEWLQYFEKVQWFHMVRSAS